MRKDSAQVSDTTHTTRKGELRKGNGVYGAADTRSRIGYAQSVVARVYAINTAAQLIFRRRGDEWIFETHTHTATHLCTVTSARHGDGVHAWQDGMHRICHGVYYPLPHTEIDRRNCRCCAMLSLFSRVMMMMHRHSGRLLQLWSEKKEEEKQRLVQSNGGKRFGIAEVTHCRRATTTQLVTVLCYRRAEGRCLLLSLSLARAGAGIRTVITPLPWYVLLAAYYAWHWW